MDADHIMLEMVRNNPLKYFDCGDMWLFNFGLLNFNMKTCKVRLNPNMGTDETVADWLTLHDISVSEWFFDHFTDKDYFLPAE